MKKLLRILVLLTAFLAVAYLIEEIGFWLIFKHRILPNIYISGVEVSGLETKQAVEKLRSKTDTLGELTFVYGGSEWNLNYGDLGVVFNQNKAVASAWQIGRSDNASKNIWQRWQRLWSRKDFEVSLEIDQTTYDLAISKIANQIEIPAKEPEISQAPTSGEISILPGENGMIIDSDKIRNIVLNKAKRLEGGTIQIETIPLLPKLTEGQMMTLRNRVNSLKNKSIELRDEKGTNKWIVNQELIWRWLDPQSNGWKRWEVEDWINQMAAAVNVKAENASFRFVTLGKVEEFKPAKTGRSVMQTELVNQLVEKLSDLEMGNEIQLVLNVPFKEFEPEVTIGEVNNLGINELLGKGESWFVGSITNRIFNLKKAAEALNGTLIAPDTVFTFNGTVGEISSATGYKSAYIIKEGKTILGDGGGVCQTSTTLFRAVLNSGLPIEERSAHAYRVSYYEQNYQPGFDATVFQPAPDFKFKNDTQAYVLIQTEFDEKTKKLTVYLYGTSDGRKVEVSKARIWDVTPPPPDLYIDDPTIPMGKIQQTEHKANGAKVAFDWKVTRGEEILINRTFYSNYKAWQAVYLRGTKTP